MFIALRDLWFARGRFLLMGVVIALIAMLMVLLTGLATGLVTDNISGIRALPADQLSFSAESGGQFSRSTVQRSQWESAAALPGVTAAAPLGNTLANAQAFADADEAARAADEITASGGSVTKGVAVDIALFGVEPDSFIAPEPADGQPLGGTPDGVLASAALLDEGVSIGDTIVIDRVGTTMTVVGTTGEANFGHVPVVYAPLGLWQRVTFPNVTGDAGEVATLIALRTDGADLAAFDAEQGLVTKSKKASYSGSPGYSEETGTLLLIELFLYAIATGLMGAFFTVWTIQRRHEIGLLKALGATTGYVLRDALGQALLVLAGATAVGLLAGLGLGAVVPGGAPFALEPGPVLVAGVLVVLAGLLGATVSIRRIAKVDPLIALGGAR